MSGRGHVEIRMSQEELKLMTLACQREIDYFHSGELKKRDMLMQVYRRMLAKLDPMPFMLREDAKDAEEADKRMEP